MRKQALFLIILFFICLLFFPHTAAASALEGLLLWYHSVFPVLLPFLFLSSLLIRIIRPEDIPKVLTIPFTRLFHCSSYGVFVILAGFICGVPVGVRLSAELYQQKKISREEMYYLQGFANNLSPGFILSYLSSEEMNLSGQGGRFLFQILGAALLFGIAEARSKNKGKYRVSAAGSEHNDFKSAPISFAVIDDCMYGAMNSALRLCAYIMFFAVITGMLTHVLPTSNPSVLLLTASIEATNGIRMITESPLPYAVKYVAVSALAAFGGWSALAQSAGIGKMDKEMIFHYIKSRVKITLLAICLSLTVLLLQH